MLDKQQKEVWDALWSRQVSYAWDPLSQTVYEFLTPYVLSLQGTKILEAGSGTGKISLRLAEGGAAVTLVDYSSQALSNSRDAFAYKGCEGTFILSDIRDMKVRADHYDLVWNAGVLEHFIFEEKVAILEEIKRITRPGGYIIILTPYAKCLPYRAGKAFAEKHGLWMYGMEEPVHTLAEEFRESGITLLEERDIGFLNSLDFLDFMPDSYAVKQLLSEWYTGLPKDEQTLYPGYLLASVGQKS